MRRKSSTRQGRSRAPAASSAVPPAIAGSLWCARQSQHVTTYGSARWAKYGEIDRAGLFGETGVFLGRMRGRYLRHDGPEHVMAFAPTRSGKGVGLVIPTLLSWTGSTVVHENDERTAKRISDALGVATEQRAMRNYADHRLAPWLAHVMVSRQETARPLLTQGEVMQLPPADELAPVGVQAESLAVAAIRAGILYPLTAIASARLGPYRFWR